MEEAWYESDAGICLNDNVVAFTSQGDASSQSSVDWLGNNCLDSREPIEDPPSEEVRFRERHSTASSEPENKQGQLLTESRPSIFDEEYDFDVPEEYLNISLGPANVSSLTEADSFDLDSFLGIKKQSNTTQNVSVSRLMTSLTATSQHRGSGGTNGGPIDTNEGPGNIKGGTNGVPSNKGNTEMDKLSSNGIDGGGLLDDLDPSQVVQGEPGYNGGQEPHKGPQDEAADTLLMYANSSPVSGSHNNTFTINSDEAGPTAELCASEGVAVSDDSEPLVANPVKVKVSGSLKKPSTYNIPVVSPVRNIEIESLRTSMRLDDEYPQDEGKDSNTGPSVGLVQRASSSQQTKTKAKFGSEAATTKSSNVVKSFIPSKPTSLKAPTVRTAQPLLGLKKKEPLVANNKATFQRSIPNTESKVALPSKAKANITSRPKTTTSANDPGAKTQHGIPVPQSKRVPELGLKSRLAKPASKPAPGKKTVSIDPTQHKNTSEPKLTSSLPSKTVNKPSTVPSGVSTRRPYSTPVKDLSKRRSIATSTPSKIPSPSSKHDPYSTPVTNRNETFTKDNEEGGAKEKDTTKLKRRSLIPMPSDPANNSEDKSPVHVHGGGLKRVGRPHMVVKRDLTTGIRKIGGPGVKGQRLAGPMKAPQHKISSAMTDDCNHKEELQMIGKPKVFHSPIDKENAPTSPHSEWSPVRRKKNVPPDEECFQCTKYTRSSD